MNSNTLDEILNRLIKIENRLDNIEKKDIPLKRSQLTRTTGFITKSEIPIETHTPTFTKKKEKKQEGHFLGYVGSACILLASIILIKLSIDSGWLTPIRQCILASILAMNLIATPFFFNLKDKSYTSLLPALGIVILHLTIYGAVFFHKLLDPTLGIVSISLISLLSLWLLNKLFEETYAILAIIGTYLGALFFHNSFSQLSLVASYLIIWDITFSLFSIKLKKRFIITISSYLALVLVSFFGIIKGINTDEFNNVILILQGIQFLIFAITTILFSIINKIKLTASEAWSFFPIIIFFYGQEYFFICRISEIWATIFSIGFIIILLSFFSIAKKRLDNEKLKSGEVIYTICSLIFTHSIFIAQMNDLARIIFTFATIVFIVSFHKKIIKNQNIKGVMIVSCFILLYAYLSVLFGICKINLELLLIFGTFFGIIFLILSSKIPNTKSGLILNLGHAQIFVTIFRLKAFIGHFAIAPLWIAYAFGILYWAQKSNDKDMAKGAIPLIIIGLSRFLVFDFSKLSGGQQVASLLIMGGLIFAGGLLYRTINVVITNRSDR